MSTLSSERLRRPQLVQWKNWEYLEYLAYFLSCTAVKARLKGENSPVSGLSTNEIHEFCEPIRQRIHNLFRSKSPRISIVIPAFNEETELLPTLVSYTTLDVPDGLAELIVVDNNSTDHTSEIIRECGAKYVCCETPRVGYCRQAGYEAVSPTAEYVWMSDADTRVIAPLKTIGDVSKKSTILSTNYQYLDAHDNVIGISTGGVVEGAHWLYRLVRSVSLRTGVSSQYSCWAGCNQFIRKWALDELGGIDTEVEFGDDHHRHYELARLGKRLKKHLESANSNPMLRDPVYHSGRRYATIGLLLRHYFEALTRPRLPRDEYGYPIHLRKQPWRQIRLSSSK